MKKVEFIESMVEGQTLVYVADEAAGYLEKNEKNKWVFFFFAAPGAWDTIGGDAEFFESLQETEDEIALEYASCEI